MFSLMITVALLTTAEVGKQAKCPRTERIKRMWCIHTVRDPSALGKKEILQLATTWMNLEDAVLSGISQPQKEKCCRSPLL